MHIANCPYCKAKAQAYPFIARMERNFEPKHVFGNLYILKSHTEEIPVAWTVECSEYCEDFMNNPPETTAQPTKDRAIEEWNKWAYSINPNE